MQRKLEKRDTLYVPTAQVHAAILQRLVKNGNGAYDLINDIAPSLLWDWTSDSNIIIYAIQHDLVDIVRKSMDIINEQALRWRDIHGNTILQSAGRKVFEYLSQCAIMETLVELQSEVQASQIPIEEVEWNTEHSPLLPKQQNTSWSFCAIL